MSHVSVLLHEAVDGLDIKPDDCVVDGTINGGGHSEAIVMKLGNQGTLLGIDLDAEALAAARERLAQASCRVLLHEGNFAKLDEYLASEGISEVDKFIFDLGMSSRQLDSSERGFSFRFDEPLLMTFRKSPREGDLTAREIVNDWDEENIADIIYGYGEEKFSRRIAAAIIEARQKNPIDTTGQLVSIIESATPSWYHHKRKHFATRTFQALRITVNNEMESVKEGIGKAIDKTKPGGRIAVITFHSMEDRIVKNIFRDAKKEGKGVPTPKKPIEPSVEEVKENPRARSAKLRIFEKTA